MPAHTIVLLIIDGLTWRVVQPAIQNGRLPFLAALAERGTIQPCVSIFPSITPAATAAIITGVGPAKSGIQGANWRDTARQMTPYFGDSLQVVLREGFAEYVGDYLHELNETLLTVPTLFEEVQRAGMKTAGLNFMWRRGMTAHEVDTPLLMRLLPESLFENSIHGPDWLFMGDFVKSELPKLENVSYPGTISNKYGFNDQATLAQLAAILQSDADPALTVAYFPENDFDSHSLGAEGALATLEKLDQGLTKIAEQQGGIERWLEETTLIVVGDHGHDDLVEDKSERIIMLDQALSRWHTTPVGGEPQTGDQLTVCPNMRAAQITVQGSLADDAGHIYGALAEQLLGDPRIDQVIQRANEGWIEIITSDRGRFAFKAADSQTDNSNERQATDSLGREWLYEGSLPAIDMTLKKERGKQDRLVDGEYPLVLKRLAEGSPSVQPSLWATARPGHEFAMPGTKVHLAGSHGSLHVSDSQTVLIAAGVPAEQTVPNQASITDVAKLCKTILGILNDQPVGDQPTATMAVAPI